LFVYQFSLLQLSIDIYVLLFNSLTENEIQSVDTHVRPVFLLSCLSLNAATLTIYKSRIGGI